MDSKIWYIPAKNDRLEKNVGIYCRVSTSERDQLNSLSAQISALTRAISHVSQWKLSDTFIDIASARGDSPRREFERMIQECEVHRISVILTKSISRFGRDTVDTLTALNRMKASGVRVIFEKENINTLDAKGEVLMTIMASLAQQESESLSANVRLGLQFRYQQGKVQVNHNWFLGYTKDEDGHLIIDQE